MSTTNLEVRRGVTVQVRILRDFSYAGRKYQAGTVTVIQRGLARLMVAQGAARGEFTGADLNGDSGKRRSV